MEKQFYMIILDLVDDSTQSVLNVFIKLNTGKKIDNCTVI